MSSQELLQLFNEHYSRLGVRNVSCGMLRRIGKTHCLKLMIMQLFEETRSNQTDVTNIIVITPTLDMGRHGYQDFLQQRIVQNYTPQTIQRIPDSGFNGVRADGMNFFADEVPNAEQLLNDHFQNANFIAGFYSEESRFFQERNQQTEQERITQLFDDNLISREAVIRHLGLSTDEAAERFQQLGEAIAQPLRQRLDYESIARSALNVQPLPEGALPNYEIPDLPNYETSYELKNVEIKIDEKNKYKFMQRML